VRSSPRRRPGPPSIAAAPVGRARPVLPASSPLSARGSRLDRGRDDVPVPRLASERPVPRRPAAPTAGRSDRDDPLRVGTLATA
jgi:hypothetical protein